MNIGVTCIMYYVERERVNGGGEGTQILFGRGCDAQAQNLYPFSLVILAGFFFHLQTLTILQKRTHIKLHLFRKRNPCLGILW